MFNITSIVIQSNDKFTQHISHIFDFIYTFVTFISCYWTPLQGHFTSKDTPSVGSKRDQQGFMGERECVKARQILIK